MNVTELKDYILEDYKIKIPKILESLDCHSIKEYENEFRSALPNKTNKTAIVVNKYTLSSKIYNAESNVVKGDILTIVMTLKSLTFYNAIQYIHKLFGLKHDKSKNKRTTEDEIDPLEVFKRVKHNKRTCNVKDFELYDEDLLDEYSSYPHIDLIKEGITPRTCQEFSVQVSYKHKRIIFNHRYWCGDRNTYIGSVGRTLISSYEVLEIPKYLAIKPFPKSMNLYGLNENYQYIQESGYVVVFESEKSVLKRHSRMDKTCVACGSHDLSDEQIKILIGLNVEIVIAWDKDIPLDHVEYTCDKFYGIRNVSYIYDKWDLLGKKESPADAHNKVYNYLFKHRVKYDV
jgi:RNA polymerase subunit RPABC4/transcription elongation factor Spt4